MGLEFSFRDKHPCEYNYHVMPPKQTKTTLKANKEKAVLQRSRNWTIGETVLFARILADEENNFCDSLERLALKKSANNEVFEAIKTIFDVHRAELEFETENEINNFKYEKGETIKYEPLDTSFLKLRRKYASIKAEWRKLDDIAKKGSGLSPKREPKWYKILNPIFTETNEPLELSSGIEDIFFIRDTGGRRRRRRGGLFRGTRFRFRRRLRKRGVKLKAGQLFVEGKCTISKTVVAPHKKGNIAKGFENMASAQIKKTKMIVDKKRDGMFLKHKAEEAKRS